MDFMNEALIEARKSYQHNEIPVGCVLVKDDKIIGRGHNTLNDSNHVVSHAEINAIEEATKKINTWNLSGCIMYVTLEPCMMCAGAIYLSRIKKVVIGALSEKGGFLLSNFNIKEGKGVNHRPDIEIVENDESKELLKRYFKEKRMNQPIVRIVTAKEELEDCLSIRKEVFVKEQNVSIEEEIDDYDQLNQETIHLIAYRNEKAVGTLRIIPKGHHVYKIGRVAVLKTERKFKVGYSMMQYAENVIRNRSGNEIQLEAQLHAIQFYQKCGYKEEGKIFLDANIEHKLMRKKIKENQ